MLRAAALLFLATTAAAQQPFRVDETTIAAVHAAMAAGRLSCRELVDRYLARIGAYDKTGPALNGTDLRDATGQIEFGQFRNQIEYQDAGSAINNEVKTAVLGGIDPASLSGKTVSVIGVFKLVNPKNWVVTPVRFDVK